MSELLLELLSEEIPASMQQPAAEALAKNIEKYLTRAEINFDKIDYFYGPRRITILIKNLAAEIAAKKIEVKGPNISAPEQAINGFLKANNCQKDDLTIEEVKGKEFYFYKSQQPAKDSIPFLQEILPKVIGEIVWPKSMYWSDFKINWVRPLKNILCVFNNENLAFKYAHLKSNNITYGHRFKANNEIIVTDFSNYESELQKHYVVVNQLVRKSIIREQIAEIEKENSFKILEDDNLLDEVTNLVEWPNCLVGRINKEFLSVPKEILISAMRSHQKYFSCINEQGEFVANFVFATNSVPDNKDFTSIINGNEKVLMARLNDAKFFYETDLNTDFSKFANKLENITFHEKLGSMADKIQRMLQIAELINASDQAKTAIKLAKNDLVTEIVGEFPELQGLMGYYYAKAANYSQEIALAIKEHYQPQGPNDDLPNDHALFVALTDKLDSLVGLYLAGEKATSSKDPYGLRRLAIGIIRIIEKLKLDISLIALIKNITEYYNLQISNKDEKIAEIVSFLQDRFKFYYKNQYRSEIINSVLAVNSFDNISDVLAKISALSNQYENDSFNSLIAGFKRAFNILKAEKKEINFDYNTELFQNEYEFQLAKHLDMKQQTITKNIDAKQYIAVMEDLASFEQPINLFFDQVMVKDKDAKIAENRLRLLSAIVMLFQEFAHFEQL